MQGFLVACCVVALVARLAYNILTWHTDRKGRAAFLFPTQEEADRRARHAPALIALGALLLVGGLGMFCWAGNQFDAARSIAHVMSSNTALDEARTYERLLYLSFLPIAAGGGLLRVGIHRMKDPGRNRVDPYEG